MHNIIQNHTTRQNRGRPHNLWCDMCPSQCSLVLVALWWFIIVDTKVWEPLSIIFVISISALSPLGLGLNLQLLPCSTVLIFLPLWKPLLHPISPLTLSMLPVWTLANHLNNEYFLQPIVFCSILANIMALPLTSFTENRTLLVPKKSFPFIFLFIYSLSILFQEVL